jgi:hypothetical protein
MHDQQPKLIGLVGNENMRVEGIRRHEINDIKNSGRSACQ